MRADFADVECLIGADDESEGLGDGGIECWGNELQRRFTTIAGDDIGFVGRF